MVKQRALSLSKKMLRPIDARLLRLFVTFNRFNMLNVFNTSQYHSIGSMLSNL